MTWPEAMTPDRLERIRTVLRQRQPDLTVITDEVHKGRNTAAIMRTCDAVGIDTLHVVVPSEDYRPYSGTALGTQKWVCVQEHQDLITPIRRLKGAGFQTVVTSVADGARDFRAIDYCAPTAVIVGSENCGVSEVALAQADHKVTIPMVGMVESFNVSVACSIILLEAQRQRQSAGMYSECRLPQRLYNQRFFKWAHPAVAEFCEQNDLPYPEVDDSGEIAAASEWYKKIRVDLKKRH